VTRKYKTFNQFWPYYVSEHSKPATRHLHFFGTTNLLVLLLLALFRRSPRLFFFAVISSYGFAWYGHFVIERNRPATLSYPILSALGDLNMYVLTCMGRMDEEVAKYAK
jgi:hypothetical protein